MSEARYIVVTIPKCRLKEVEAEEREVAARVAAGETDIVYYWAMRRLPAWVDDVKRVYFVWDNAIRAYHDVVSYSYAEGRIYLDVTIHEIEPETMFGFRGFGYYTPKELRLAS